MKIKCEALPGLDYFVGKAGWIASFVDNQRSGLGVLLFSGYQVLAGDQILF
jgi:hypothetical protein